MQFAEGLGRFRELVNRQEERLEEDRRRGVPYGAEPLREDRERMLRDKKEELKHEEARFLEMVEEVVRCECRG
jgi:hypothetical protein